MRPSWRYYLGWMILVIGLRGMDFYSTSLWYFQPEGYLDETNPLATLFGSANGWTAMWVVNLLLVAVILFLFWFYCFRYIPQYPRKTPTNSLSLATWQYYGKIVPAWQLLVRPPRHFRAPVAHFGFVAIHALAIGSALAVVHNMGQYFGWSGYSVFREMVGRPRWVIYGIIVLSVVLTYQKVWRLDHAWITSSSNPNYRS